MKLPDRQLLIINSTLLAGLCILTAIAILTPQSNMAVILALVAGPSLLLLSATISTWFFLRETRLRREDSEKIRQAIEGRFPESDSNQSLELNELITLIREQHSRFSQVMTDHGETSDLVSMNLERIIRLIDRMEEFIGDIDKLSSRIYHLYQRLESSLLQTDNQEDLSETILKIRFELDRFSEKPSAMLDVLKKVYSNSKQNRQSLMAAQEGFLATQSVMAEGELNIVSKQQETLQQARNATEYLEQILQNGEKAFHEGEEMLAEITTRFLSFSDEMSELQSRTSELPEHIHSISSLITELQDVQEKSKILALNASIYAGEAGEEGKGFSTIAREMKTITESAETLQHELQQRLNQLEKITLHTLEGLEQLTVTRNLFVKFSQEGQETFISHKSNHDASAKDMETLSSALNRLVESLDLLEKTGLERQSNLTRALTAARKSQEETEDERALKFQIDNMVIESSRFSERIENELPNLLDAVGSILDEVSAFQDQFLQTRNALADFSDPRIIQALKDLKQALGGNEIQLLRASTNLLQKMKKNIPTN